MLKPILKAVFGKLTWWKYWLLVLTKQDDFFDIEVLNLTRPANFLKLNNVQLDLRLRKVTSMPGKAGPDFSALLKECQLGTWCPSYSFCCFLSEELESKMLWLDEWSGRLRFNTARVLFPSFISPLGFKVELKMDPDTIRCSYSEYKEDFKKILASPSVCQHGSSAKSGKSKIKGSTVPSLYVRFKLCSATVL